MYNEASPMVKALQRLARISPVYGITTDRDIRERATAHNALATLVSEHDAFVDHVAALVASLPKCTTRHAGVATKAYVRGADRYCDACAALVSPPPPDYPRAVELRWVTDALKRLRP